MAETTTSDGHGELAERVRRGQALLACGTGTAARLAGAPETERLRSLDGVDLLACPTVEHAQKLAADHGLSHQTILDQVVILVSAADEEGAAEADRVHGRLFDLIGTCYDTLIDRERNRSNIAELYAILQLCDGHRGPVLDFGCGTGISMSVAGRPDEMYGWDRSAQMRSLAAGSGLRIVHVSSAEELPEQTFAGALASYVFDLPTAPDAVGPLLRSLRPGGVLVANFHRDKNLAQVTRDAADKGGQVTVHRRDDRHGSILSIRRTAD
jgi:hypothetical protein